MITIPNLITLARGLGVPIFLWAFLVQGSKTLALLILVFGGLTDYLDGKVARALNQESDLGKKLDPAIDRLYLIAILLAFVLKNVIPWQVAGLIIFRDLALGAILLIKRTILPVTYLGKSATFNLLYALPLLLINHSLLTRSFAWAFAIWGVGLYLLTGFSYARSAISK